MKPWLLTVALFCATPASARPIIPPVILDFLPDGGQCKAEDPAHPTPDEVWSLLQEPATDAERRDVEVVLDGCPRASRDHIDPWRVLALLRFEDVLGVPAESRLLLAGVACWESAFAPARDLYGDRGKARGPFQLHWAWAAYCMDGKTWRTPSEWRAVMAQGDFRGSLAFSARCWVAATNRALAKAEPCGSAAFVVAEAIVSRLPHPLDCSAETHHARLARGWRAAL